jgi:hypothetical protein
VDARVGTSVDPPEVDLRLPNLADRLASMRNWALVPLFVALAASALPAASKPHVVAFGKWQTVKWFSGSISPQPPGGTPGEASPRDLKIRPLYVDSKLKESTVGPAHEVTDRIFVVRRAYRVNDSLPAEEGKALRWRWQLGGWLQVDRVSGRVSALNLPEFDPEYSLAAWYRDYAAYCGVSDDGKKLFVLVAQLGRRKAVLKKPMGETSDGGPEANCGPPRWQRMPIQVTFAPANYDEATFLVRGHSADLVPEEPEEEIPTK